MIKYRKEIDGLRAIAVIPVILFHLGFSFVQGGFLGVDVFFVISGFLITKILTDSIQKDKFSMYKFWIRRVKRLLPLLITVILTTLIIAPLLVFKPVVLEISRDIFPALFSYSNYHALYDFGNYWGSKSEQSFFLHTWSLSVEEQFYLIYPFFLFLVHKYFKNFIIPIITLTILSLALFFYFLKVKHDIDTAFYLLPTRLWELSIGGLTGLISLNKFRLPKKPMPFIGILMILFSYFMFSGSGIGRALIPVVGTSLVLMYCSPNDIIGKILSTKPFVFIGKISYSLYLWHWGVIVLFKNLTVQLEGIDQLIVSGLILLITFVLAYLSYTFIENKTRHYKHTPKIVLAGIAVITGLTLYYQSNLFNPHYESEYNQQTYYLDYYSISPSLSNSQHNPEDDLLCYDVIVPERPDKFKNAYRQNGIITDDAHGTPEILLLGDSHGVMWAKLLDEISSELDLTLSCYASNGDPPFFNVNEINSQTKTKHFSVEQRVEYAKSIVENINKWNPKLVIIASRWDSPNEENKQLLDGMLNYFEEQNIQVLIINQPPVLEFMENKNASQYFSYLGLSPTEGYNMIELTNSKVKESNQSLEDLTSKHKNLTIFDVYENMIIENKVKVTYNKEVLYFDDDHLCYYGTFIHKNELSSTIDSLIKDHQ